MMLLIAFVAFFAMVVAWLVAPATPKADAAPVIESGTFVAAESPV